MTFGLRAALTSFLLATAFLAVGHAHAQQKALLNASSDTAREVFTAINPKFVDYWKRTSGEAVKIDQSFAASSRQAQDIIGGKRADTVTFNQVIDIDALVKRGMVTADWSKKFPNNASPYYSATAFLVRKGNPKNIRNWDDLARTDVKLVFPNPKTSGNGRYAYLGAWLYANEKFNGDQAQIKSFVGKVLRNNESFPTGGRAATLAFANNGQGDVLVSFEAEVSTIVKNPEFKAQGFEVVVPPISVLSEFPVAVVDKVVDAKGTRNVATAYLQFLYSREIQQLLTTFYYRVHDPEVVKATASQFPNVRLIDPTKVLGSWDKIFEIHFAANATLDQLLAQRR